jgi:hypothetical protein
MRYLTIPATVVLGGQKLTFAELVKVWTNDGAIFGKNVETLLHAVHLREVLAGGEALAGVEVPIDEAAWALLAQAAANPTAPYVPDTGIAILPIIRMIQNAPATKVPSSIRNTNGNTTKEKAARR